MDGLAIAASLNEMRQTLRGATIQSIYQPEEGVFVLHLFSRKPVRLLLAPKDAAIHLTALDLPHPKTPSPFVMLLRKYLRRGRMIGIHQAGWDRIVRLDIEPREEVTPEHISLIIELLGPHGNLLLAKGNSILATYRPDSQNPPNSIYLPPTPQIKLNPAALDLKAVTEILESPSPNRALVRSIDGIGQITAQAILARAKELSRGPFEEKIIEVITFLLSKVEQPQAEYRREDQWATFFPLVPPATPMPSFSAACDKAYLEKRDLQHRANEEKWARLEFERAIAKRERTIKRMKAWLKKAEKADHLRHHADLIMLHVRDLTRGMESAILADPQTEEIDTILLNPRLTPVENAQSMYKRAKRLARGRPIVARRLERIEKELNALRSGLKVVRSGELPDTAASLLLPSSPFSQSFSSKGAPRTYQILGYTILVGRNARENDELLRQAGPNDLWLHAKGVPGAHVIIRSHGRERIPQTVIKEAARLAVQSSKAKEERRVEVSYTPTRYVRKPKGTRAGLVNLTREDTLTVDLRRKDE
jgi:predicted ribosome quality control (RQC) complex YloA/Tae2 family protein